MAAAAGGLAAETGGLAETLTAPLAELRSQHHIPLPSPDPRTPPNWRSSLDDAPRRSSGDDSPRPESGGRSPPETYSATQVEEADEPSGQNVAELCLEIARLRILNQQTLVERETAARIANDAHSQLADARAAINALQLDLGFARRLATASATDVARMQREAVELDESNRAARSLLAELVVRLQRLAGGRVAADVVYAASMDPAVAAVAGPVDRSEVLATEAAVRKALEDARADVARLERRSAELERRSATAKPPRGADDAQLRAELAALRMSERLAQSQAVSMRLALTAAHAELQAYRRHASRGGASRGGERTSGRADGTRASAPAGAHAASVGGWELVECVPGLEPAASGADAAAPMPDSMLARVRGATYRMTRVRGKEVGAAMTRALSSDDAALLQLGVERGDDMRTSSPNNLRIRPATAHSASRAPASVQMRHPALSAAPMPSALAVRQHAGELMGSSPAATLFSEAAQRRPRTAPGEPRGPRTPAQTLSILALRHERHVVAGQLANLWSAEA